MIRDDNCFCLHDWLDLKDAIDYHQCSKVNFLPITLCYINLLHLIALSFWLNMYCLV
ncbi:unnamed protein product [Arabidopsis halleri]